MFYLLHHIKRNKDHILMMIFVWLMFTIMFIDSTYGVKLYHKENLIYFWDFENEKSYLNDRKKNIELQQQGKVRWVPPDHSFNESGVVHLHGDKSEGTMLIVPTYKMDLELKEWTIDFEFGAGVHPLDHRKRNAGGLVDGNLFQWGDVKISFRRSVRNKWQGILVVDYRGRKKFIEGVKGFDWYYMAIRSEDEGVSIWLDSYCTNYIRSPRRSVTGKQISFGGSGFAGRIDDIKLYNKRLRPWDIKDNYWGKELSIKFKGRLITTWSKIKYH